MVQIYLTSNQYTITYITFCLGMFNYTLCKDCHLSISYHNLIAPLVKVAAIVLTCFRYLSFVVAYFLVFCFFFGCVFFFVFLLLRYYFGLLLERLGRVLGC